MLQAAHASLLLLMVAVNIGKTASLLPSNKNRSFLVHSLINKLNLLSNSPTSQELHHVSVITPRRATKEGLCLYHDEEYINFVLDKSQCQSATTDFGIEDVFISSFFWWFPWLTEYAGLSTVLWFT